MALNNELKSARKGAKLTQRQTAEALGVASTTVSKWETGDTKPDIDTLLAICRLYNVTPNELLGYNDEFIPEVVIINQLMKQLPQSCRKLIFDAAKILAKDCQFKRLDE